jgi:hypothetical protein
MWQFFNDWTSLVPLTEEELHICLFFNIAYPKSPKLKTYNPTWCQNRTDPRTRSNWWWKQKKKPITQNQKPSTPKSIGSSNLISEQAFNLWAKVFQFVSKSFNFSFCDEFICCWFFLCLFWRFHCVIITFI